jgi:hypothetical protein
VRGPRIIAGVRGLWGCREASRAEVTARGPEGRFQQASVVVHLGLLHDVEHEGLAVSATVGTDTEVHLLGEGVSLEGGREPEDGVGWRHLHPGSVGEQR